MEPFDSKKVIWVLEERFREVRYTDRRTYTSTPWGPWSIAECHPTRKEANKFRIRRDDEYESRIVKYVRAK